MTYAYDPEITPWLKMLPSGPTDLHELRALGEAAVRGGLPSYEPDIAVAIHDATVPGPEGAPDVMVRVYAPAEREGLLPGLLFVHGGGFIMGSVEQFDAVAVLQPGGEGVFRDEPVLDGDHDRADLRGDAGGGGTTLSNKWTGRPTFMATHRTAETAHPFHFDRVGA